MAGLHIELFVDCVVLVDAMDLYEGLSGGEAVTAFGLIAAGGLPGSALISDDGSLDVGVEFADGVDGVFLTVFSFSCLAFWRCLARRFLNHTCTRDSGRLIFLAASSLMNMSG